MSTTFFKTLTDAQLRALIASAQEELDARKLVIRTRIDFSFHPEKSDQYQIAQIKAFLAENDFDGEALDEGLCDCEPTMDGVTYDDRCLVHHEDTLLNKEKFLAYIHRWCAKNKNN